MRYLRLHQNEFGTDRVASRGTLPGLQSVHPADHPDDTSFAGRELHRGVSDSIDGFIGFYGYYGGNQLRSAAY